MRIPWFFRNMIGSALSQQTFVLLDHLEEPAWVFRHCSWCRVSELLLSDRLTCNRAASSQGFAFVVGFEGSVGHMS